MSGAALSSSTKELARLGRALERLEGQLLKLERELTHELERVAPSHRPSATNLVHYLALRQRDLRALQRALSDCGLSSLGRSEGHVLGSLRAVSQRLDEALLARSQRRRRAPSPRGSPLAGLTWAGARVLLHAHSHEVLGPKPGDRHVAIMVTAPPAREGDRAWMARLLRAGMNVLRINCAHESEHEWLKLVGALRAARKETGKPCRVLMDLAGPKIRTGPIAGSEQVATWKPARDAVGRPIRPAQVRIVREGAPAPEGAALFLGGADFAVVQVGDVLRLRDARGKRRALQVEGKQPDALLCTALERAWVEGRFRARLERTGRGDRELTLEVRGGPGPAIELQPGDPLVLTRRRAPGQRPVRDAAGRVVTPGVVSCTLPAALQGLKLGHRVAFDDGKIEAQVERADPRRGEFLLRVLRTKTRRAQLRAEKGINLPDTQISVPSLGPDDLRALRFVAQHADAVSLSFVRTPGDVRSLHRRLDRLHASCGVVLKIETRSGFEHLPRLLLEGLRRPPLAVMIARGDLAIEVGFERLAEVQEEILWLCEAAHVPAIWATQVLETLARTGVPSRAEITDAAASVAAECVMLNKGPFVEGAVDTLADILRRMERHRDKKRSLFRRLDISSLSRPSARKAPRLGRRGLRARR